MIQLIAVKNNVQYFLDIDNNAQISINYQASDIREFSERTSNFTQTFELPFTPVNDQFFDFIYNVNQAIDGADNIPDPAIFNLYEKTQCTLVVDSIPQIEGYLYVDSINKTSRNYSVTIIGELSNFVESIKDKKLNQLDATWLNTFSHELSLTNVINSWDDLISYLSAGADRSVIKYPMIQYGINNRLWTTGGSGTNDIQVDAGAIKINELKPAFNVKTMFDRIFAESGFEYTSDFITNNDFNFSDLYFNLAGDKPNMITRQTALGFQGQKGGDQNLTTSFAVVDFPIVSTPNYNPTGNLNGAGTIWSCSVGGKYSFQFNGEASFGAGVTTEFQSKVMLNQAGGGFNNYTTFNSVFLNTGQTKNFYHSFTITLAAGDQVQIQALALSANTKLLSTTTWQMVRQPYLFEGGDLYIQDNLPDINQLDFITAVVKHFNMMIEPQADNPKVLRLEPYPDYIDDGLEVDWTDKLDISKELSIKPTTNFRSKELIWKWADDKNYLGTYRKDYNKRPYGSYKLIDESELVSGEWKYESLFGDPVNLTVSPNVGSVPIQMCVMDLSSRDKTGLAIPLVGKTRMFYFKKKTMTSSYKIYDGDGLAYTSLNDYGYAGHMSDVPSTADVFDINFSNSYSKIFDSNQWIGAPTQKDIFTSYWDRFINEIYGSDARVFTGHFNLTPVDIFNLRFNHKIFIKDCWYRINKISGYAPNNNSTCSVELVKLFEASVGGVNCNLIPSSFNIDGTVDFIDGVGNAQTSTRQCCEDLGYTFQEGFSEGEEAKCYWRLFGDPNDPNEAPNSGTLEG